MIFTGINYYLNNFNKKENNNSVYPVFWLEKYKKFNLQALSICVETNI